MTLKQKATMIGAAVVLASSAAPLYAQMQGSAPQGVHAGADNVNWNARELRNGLSVDRLVGMDARGSNGQSIGEVQDVIADANGKVTDLVIESGGFANIGDTHFRVPWNEAKFGQDMDYVIVHVSEQTAQRYQERGGNERVQAAAGSMRLGELIDANVKLRGGDDYGDVQDVILSREGRVKGVIVDADFGPGGLRALPFDAVKFDAQDRRIDLTFDDSQAKSAPRFDYGSMGIEADRGATGASQGASARGEVRGGSDARDMERGNARAARSSRG